MFTLSTLPSRGTFTSDCLRYHDTLRNGCGEHRTHKPITARLVKAAS